MSQNILFFMMAALFLCLIPLVPRLLNLRIRVLRFIHWNWLAELHERFFDRLVVIIRVMMSIGVFILLFFGVKGTF